MYHDFNKQCTGKNEIPTEHYLLRLLYAPQNDLPPPSITSTLDPPLLDSVFTMEKTPDTGIPGFDPTTLGIMSAPMSPPPATASTKRDRQSAGAESSAGEERGRKKSKRRNGAITGGEASDAGGVSTDGGSSRKKKRKTHV